MNNWKVISVREGGTIRDAIETIDSGNMQLALVVNDYGGLVGTVTDGDIRRAILRGVSLEGPVADVVNRNPTVAYIEDSQEFILSKMRSMQIFQVPVLDREGRIIRIEVMSELTHGNLLPNIAVIMAGGLGSRLYPLTDDCPKPMLRVGDKPILETILDNFIAHGFRSFYFSVNYRADLIKAYFGDGSRWGVEIHYLHEDQKLGTAGALSLLPDIILDPLVVMNGDLLTKTNFRQLLDFHSAQDGLATMCVTDFEFQVPYGVVHTKNSRILRIEEKPIHRFFVNAGIYVLEPAVLERIPIRTYFDMPSLFEDLIASGCETSVFPIREYWLDIGHIKDFDRACMEFHHIFNFRK
jgi:dTDP-glucose pyrophosphorylase/CBS domain-containing protein